MGGFNSALMKSSEEAIPEGHYEEESMKSTVVPGRNLIFASIMAGLAESVGADYVALGVHSGDHFIYPDCRMEFIKALDNTVFLSSDKTVEIITPFENMNKKAIYFYLLTQKKTFRRVVYYFFQKSIFLLILIYQKSYKSYFSLFHRQYL